LRDALDQAQALVTELESADKPLTIRKRLERAVQALGRGDLAVRRRGNRIVVYPAGLLQELVMSDQRGPTSVGMTR
jgi:hypothetical protein